MSGLDLHGPWHYEQETDPGVVGGGKWWLKKSTFQIFRRKDDNSGWDTYFQGGGTTTQSANRIFAGPASGSAAAPTFRAVVPADVPTMVASGATHAAGLVPDPGSTAGSTKFLREDGTFAYAALPYINVQDQKTSATAGGTFTSGADQTRTLNTLVTDTASIASLSTNQLTLPAGTYRCAIRCPSNVVNFHQSWLYNVTGAAVLIRGSSEFAASGSNSFINGQFVLSGSSALEVRHRCSTTRATDGFGTAASLGTEVFTVAEFWRLA
jgi:hypothetical protein